jgi:hypothetical protein
MKTNYRGFDIVMNSDGQWSAEIVNPRTGKSWAHRLTAPLSGDGGECLKRAQNMIDAFLALNGPVTA